MKRVRLKISTLSLQVTSDWIDIRTRLFSIPQTWRFVVFGRITGVTGGWIGADWVEKVGDIRCISFS